MKSCDSYNITRFFWWKSKNSQVTSFIVTRYNQKFNFDFIKRLIQLCYVQKKKKTRFVCGFYGFFRFTFFVSNYCELQTNAAWLLLTNTQWSRFGISCSKYHKVRITMLELYYLNLIPSIRVLEGVVLYSRCACINRKKNLRGS